ncbi:MIP/aquaporin family protein [Streptomyces yaizuensis]|uniref:Aquaporin family protein n=1 Tax=Streptomyces yaizuensis TaxID=2989713 RepID=A0ABQ5P1J9_9ACTN|nr:MIP/aquaporin family protein [Streptomyces sp. YSPA8]GLF96475.1 aquaporin family protein [Streptomyces sp. YSPA8]
MSNGDIFVGEVLGTAILIMFGVGVCAAVNLPYSKARATGAGWIVITFGWGFGVLAGAYASAPLSGGHLNPAVTVAIAVDTGEWGKVPLYIVAQFAGAMLGAVLAFLVYYSQFRANGEADKAQPTLGIFATAPEVRNPAANIMTEVIVTVGLVLPILSFNKNDGIGVGQIAGQGAGIYGSGISILLVAFLVVGIGLCLGSPTGYAINPARDLGPRIVHALLPIPNKGTSDWSYSWIPVAAPMAGGVIAGLLFNLIY